MKLTGYVLLAIGIILIAFACVNYLAFNVNAVETSGTLNASRNHGTYWYALLPAAATIIVGVWMIMSGSRGYHISYPPTQRPQTGT